MSGKTALLPSAYEQLGAFYLGREVSPDTGDLLPGPLLYDSKDLTTHAVCVGMTGSGKTGLCVTLLEEAAMDRVPAILIDPKGDLGNLALTFPDLAPGDFRPWIDEAEAARKGLTPDAYAKDRAELWKKGLAEWGQDGKRIRRLRESCEVALYTPGGGGARPLRVLRSLAAPSPFVRENAEALRERVSSTVSGLLVLLGVDADPVRSREHILLSTILDGAWREGADLDLPALIRRVQQPPFESVGVFDVESFFPSKDRFQLAMAINNVIASPSFAAWREGEPLDVGALLHTPDGTPRLSILSIAHLGDRERMFFVTLLLNEVVAWMRAQPGTASLRAILYMDEVFGYLPPTAMPPSKVPMLTLLKQARAYGLGVVLATQNPVDLDYKALSNAGTWFLGRLQTERDKLRVLDGLEGASRSTGASFDRGRADGILSGLKSREFLMNNVHDKAPVLFRTRWAMSYLRGPAHPAQIGALAGPAPSPAGEASASSETSEGAGGNRPVLPPGISEVFLEGEGDGKILLRPALLGRARLHHVRAAAGVDEWRDLVLLSLLVGEEEADPWASADELPSGTAPGDAPEGDVRWAELPAGARSAASYKTWGKKLVSHAYRERALSIFRCRDLKTYSRPGETEADFRGRLALVLREKRDLAVEKVKKRYRTRFERLEERIRRDAQRVEREQGQKGHHQLSTAVAVGATVLGALLGRKKLSTTTLTRAGTALRGAGRVGRETGDIERAREILAANRAKLEELEEELRDEVEALEESPGAQSLELEEIPLRPRKADLVVEPVALAWTPWRVGQDGTARPAFFREA